ncbi:MAG TPA: peptidogalycan biosysnthesis protein, partial [Propylenella sp.]|nr:peptidogalycan biosysnthesis protein [Propylenella sp.]
MSMRTEPETAAIRIVSAMAEIGRAQWDSCANPGWAGGNGAAFHSESERAPFNPFVSWDFLQALEESGAVSARTGWIPRHLVLEGKDVPGGFVP